MRTIFVALVLMLSGCASLQSWIPSFWDDNQSSKIVDVRLDIERVDCASPLEGIVRVRDDLAWFALYSESKGALNRDMIVLITPMQATVEEWYKRHKQALVLPTVSLRKVSYVNRRNVQQPLY